VTDLKFGPLPKQCMVKIALELSELLRAELDADAVEQSRLYSETVETVELIPHMLQPYMRDDRGWRKHRKKGPQAQNGRRRNYHRPPDALAMLEEAEEK
jgi:hypothetical protein